MILCDTNIFIEAFKNNPSATEMLRRIGFQNISLSAVTLMELYLGELNKRELAENPTRHDPIYVGWISEAHPPKTIQQADLDPLIQDRITTIRKA
jgi:predicted nucleic acid-binding protein